jgi:hypothetical protein
MTGPTELPHRHGIYAHTGHQLTLMHSPDVDGVWEVFYGANYLGVLREVASDEQGAWPLYQARLPGDQDLAGEDVTDDWRSAVEFLAEEAGY